MAEAGTTAGSPPPARAALALLGVALAGAVAGYARVLRGEFQFDDIGSIEQNLAVKHLGTALRSAVSSLLAAGRPVTDVTFAFNYAAGRLDPAGYHATNLAIHLAVAVLVFAFTRTVVRRADGGHADLVAAAVAGTFALHPLQTEAVSYVCQRAEALASGFYLATLLLLLEAERRGWRARGAAAYAAALVAFALGLGAKPIAVTAPAAYLLLSAMLPDPARRVTWRERLVRVAPFVALDLAFAVAVLRALRGVESAGLDVPGVTPGVYLLTQGRALLRYLALLLWPAGQNVDWRLPFSKGADAATVLAWAALVAVAGAAATLFARSLRAVDQDAAAGRVAAFGVAWFFLVLSVTSSVMPLADALVEHRVYLASWGGLVAAAVIAERALARLAPRRRTIAAAVVLASIWIALGLALHRRNAVWETRIALWTDAVEKGSGDWRARLNLGQAFRVAGDYDAALREYRAALLAAPRSSEIESFALNQAAVALLHAGRFAEASSTLDRALALTPDRPQVLVNAAVARLRQRDLGGAEDLVRRALAAAPGDGRALEVLCELRLARGDPAGALGACLASVRADPDDGVRHLALGVAYEKLGRMREACAAFGEAGRVRASPEQQGSARHRAAIAGCPGTAPPAPSPPAAP
ncbi:MAG TPA: tetratricopeptide repeat protein [Anaeromyxobacteraceae bacterium]|nr:tetratricopeptide repeat protein [Anaeromyxobacteraceae bacterium]